MARKPMSAEPVTASTMDDPLATLAAMPADVDLDALVQALQYHDHIQREQRQGNGPARKVWLAVDRPMTGADVLSHRFDGDDVLLVTADGQKWRFRPDGQAINLMEA